MTFDAEEFQSFQRVAAEWARLTMCSVSEAVAALVQLARLSASQPFEDRELYDDGAYWRRASKALARSRRNSASMKRRKHGRAQPTRWHHG